MNEPETAIAAHANGLSPLAASANPGGAALWAPHLDRGSVLPLSRQLAAALRRAIGDGVLSGGARLPSTRGLAVELGIARSTVVAVFEQLVAEGFVVSRPGSGYFVPAPADRPPIAHETLQAPAPALRRVSRQAERLRGFAPPLRGEPVPFEPGFPELDGRFLTTWKRLAARAMSGRSRLQWGYGDPQGELVLRRAIADYLAAARGVRCRPEQVALTAGTQQGLSLVARILCDPGDAVWVEDPCYRAAYDIFAAAEARIVPVPVDDAGLSLAAGRARRGTAPRFVYTTPSRQYPLGIAMPFARRMELLAWAGAEGVWIVEDDYESEFQSPSRMLPSLQGLDRAGRVVYLGTFSKLLFPSLRIGYAVLPEDLVEPFVAARHLSDRQSSALLQTILTDFILDGHFARHLKRTRALYAERQRFLTAEIAARLGGLLETRPVESGMYLTAWLSPRASDIAAAAALAAAGVRAMPLSSLVLETPRPPALVLGYTGHGEAAMARAVERMATVLTRTGPTICSELELSVDQ